MCIRTYAALHCTINKWAVASPGCHARHAADGGQRLWNEKDDIMKSVLGKISSGQREDKADH